MSFKKFPCKITQRSPTGKEEQGESRLEVREHTVSPALQSLGKKNHRFKVDLAHTLSSYLIEIKEKGKSPSPPNLSADSCLVTSSDMVFQ